MNKAISLALRERVSATFGVPGHPLLSSVTVNRQRPSWSREFCLNSHTVESGNVLELSKAAMEKRLTQKGYQIVPVREEDLLEQEYALLHSTKAVGHVSYAPHRGAIVLHASRDHVRELAKAVFNSEVISARRHK